MKKNRLSLFVGLVLLLPSFLFSAITKGPYLVKPTQNSMTIMWESDSNESAKVIYWQKGMAKNAISVSSLDSQNNHFLYSALVKGLEANKKYFYKVVMKKDSSHELSFYSAPLLDEAFSFVVMGDSRSGHDTFAKVASLVEHEKSNLIISMGDLVLNGKDYNEWGTHFFSPAKSMLSHIPFVSTLGDHETRDNYNGNNLYYFFRNGVNTDKQWFSYDYGSVHFVSLDFRGDNNKEMIDWFKEDMTKSNAKWKIVYLHRPTYNLGGHRTNWGNPIWQKLYNDYKVDVVFAGHSHIYERFFPLTSSESKDKWGVTYITTGGAGAGLYDIVESEFTAVTKSTNHYSVVSVDKNTFTITAKDLEGNIIDNFEIVKTNGKHSKSYSDLMINEKPLDIYMAFAGELDLRVRENLKDKKSFTKEISISSKGIGFDVPFKIQLTKDSEKYYEMVPVVSTLMANQKFNTEVEVVAKKGFVKRKKFFEPSLFIEVVYEYKGKKYVVAGSECRYYLP